MESSLFQQEFHWTTLITSSKKLQYKLWRPLKPFIGLRERWLDLELLVLISAMLVPSVLRLACILTFLSIAGWLEIGLQEESRSTFFSLDSYVHESLWYRTGAMHDCRCRSKNLLQIGTACCQFHCKLLQWCGKWFLLVLHVLLSKLGILTTFLMPRLFGQTGHKMILTELARWPSMVRTSGFQNLVPFQQVGTPTSSRVQVFDMKLLFRFKMVI
jgi:hypothetical protein